MPSWVPVQYGRYAGERARPFTDLMARVEVEAPRLVVDLGCGTGALTASLAERWPGAEVLGVDSSPAMLERAAPLASTRLRFEHADVARWRPAAPVDVLVTNATLQWVPGHLDLLRRWVGALADGGVLALQVPANFDAPSHRLMREVAESPEFAPHLAGVLRGSESVAEPPQYAELLAEAGCAVDVWQTTYLHVLPGEDAVLEWVRGTGLRPVLDALDPDASRAFVDRYAARLRTAYPRRPWGTLLPFRRIFAVATRSRSEGGHEQ